MKNITIALVILFLVPATCISQESALKNLFEKYKNRSGFDLDKEDTSINIDFDSDFDLGKFLNKIDKMYVLNFEHHEGDKDDLVSFKAKLNKIIDKENYATMIDIKGDEKFAMLVRKDDSGQTMDVLMISEEDNESTFIWAGADDY
jgi:hypothetical protein